MKETALDFQLMSSRLYWKVVILECIPEYVISVLMKSIGVENIFSGDTWTYLEISLDVPPLTLDRDSKRATCSIATTVLCRNIDRDCAHVKLIS